MGKSQKILVQSFIINILTIFVYYSLSHQPELTSYISTNTKSVEYRLHIRRGTHARDTHAKGRINNQFLITGFGISREAQLFVGWVSGSVT